MNTEKYIGNGNPNSGSVRSIMLFPNSYEVGMSSLGFHIIYEMIATNENFSVKRAFIENLNDKILTYETNESLYNFDIIFISLSFELDYINLFKGLRNSGLLADYKTRDKKNFPILFIGGPAVTLNPEIIANYLDVVYIGEAETNFNIMLDTVSNGVKNKLPRQEILNSLYKIEGLYIPSNFNPIYDNENKFIGFKEQTRIKRQIKKDLTFGARSVFVTENRAFSSEFLIETGRGCEQGCKFCMSTTTYRPVRKFNKDLLIENINKYNKYFESVGLVGAAVSSHPKIKELAKSILDSKRQASFSSLRADYIDDEFLEILKRMNVKTISLAPEAGNEQLRFSIGKRITNQCFFDVIRKLSNIVKTIRFYFIVGLPNETEDDVKTIINFIKEARQVLKESKSNVKLVLSVNPFIPKAFTQYGIYPMLEEKSLKKRFELLKKDIYKISNTDLKIESLKESYVQGLFSRGDRRVGDLLFKLVNEERESIGEILREAKKIDVGDKNLFEYYVFNTFSKDDVMPYHIIDFR